MLDGLLAIAPKILPFAEPVWERLDQARRAGNRILFEGAQAVMLDVDHGTYPFVTSSNHDRRHRGWGQRGWAVGRGLRAGDCQGVLHPGRQRAVPHGAAGRHGAGCSASGAMNSAP